MSLIRSLIILVVFLFAIGLILIFNASSADVLDHGAELCSIFDKRNQREMMWKKDETYWNRYSPILFPQAQ